MSELALQRKVMKMIKKDFPEAFAYKAHDQFTVGLPDVMGCISGIFFGIELKDPGQKPRPLQEYVLERIRNAGGYAMWATTVEQCRQFLSDLQNIKEGGDTSD